MEHMEQMESTTMHIHENATVEPSSTSTSGGSSRCPSQQQTLRNRALEIVLQHWMIPSNNLHGWNSLMIALEKERLPLVQEEIQRLPLSVVSSTTVEQQEDQIGQVLVKELESKLSIGLDQNREEEEKEEEEVQTWIASLQDINVEVQWLPQVLTSMNENGEDDNVIEGQYRVEDILKTMRSIYLEYWSPLSYRLQRYTISLTLQFRDAYDSFMLSIATLFKKQRERYQNQEGSSPSIANVLVYQMTVHTKLQRFVNKMERLLFSMTMLSCLIDTELRQNTMATEINPLYEGFWVSYCIQTFLESYGLHDFSTNPNVSKEIAINMLTLFQTHLMEKIVTRYQAVITALTTSASESVGNEESVTGFIQQMDDATYHINLFASHLLDTNKQSSSNEEESSIGFDMNLQEALSSLVSFKLNRQVHPTLVKVLEVVYQQRFTIHTEWLFPLHDITGGTAQLFHVMSHHENDCTTNITFDTSNVLVKPYTLMMPYLRQQASILCDIMICLQMKVSIIEQWFGGPIMVLNDEIQSTSNPVDESRSRLTTNTCVNMIQLYSKQHHCFYVLIKVLSYYLSIEKHSKEELKALTIASSPSCGMKSYREIVLHLNEIVPLNTSEKILSLVFFMIEEIERKWIEITPAFYMLRSCSLSQSSTPTQEAMEVPVKGTIVNEVRLQFAEVHLIISLEAFLNQVDARYYWSRMSLPGVIDNEDEQADEDNEKNEDYWQSIRQQLAIHQERNTLCIELTNRKEIQLDSILEALTSNTMIKPDMVSTMTLSIPTSLSPCKLELYQHLYDQPCIGFQLLEFALSQTKVANAFLYTINCYTNRLRDAICCLNRDVISYFQYDFLSMEENLVLFIDLVQYFFTLRNHGSDALELSIAILEGMIPTQQQLSTKKVTCKSLLQEWLQCRQNFFSYHLVGKLHHEMFRTLQLLVMQYVYTGNYDQSVNPFVSTLLQRAKAVMTEVEQIHKRWRSAIHRQTFAKNVTKEEQLIRDRQCLFWKCKMMHMLIGIRTELLLTDRSTSSSTVEKEEEEEEQDNALKWDVQRAKESYLMPFAQYWSEFETVLQLIEPLLFPTTTTTTTTVQEEQQPQSLDYIDDVLFWFSTYLEYSLIDLETRDYLGSYIYPQYVGVTNSFPFGYSIQSTHEQLFKSTHTELMVQCQSVMKKFLTYFENNNKSTSESVQIMECFATYYGTDAGSLASKESSSIEDVVCLTIRNHVQSMITVRDDAQKTKAKVACLRMAIMMKHQVSEDLRLLFDDI